MPEQKTLAPQDEFQMEQHESGREQAEKRLEQVRNSREHLVSPAEAPDLDAMREQRPQEKDLTGGYPKKLTNDRLFSLKELDDKTNVEVGQVMENLVRAPAHEADEVAVEEDAPGFDTASAMITPRGNPAYEDVKEDESLKNINPLKG